MPHSDILIHSDQTKYFPFIADYEWEVFQSETEWIRARQNKICGMQKSELNLTSFIILLATLFTFVEISVTINSRKRIWPYVY